MSNKVKNKTQTSEVTSRRLTVALAGNPNAGKTTLFNVLTDSHQRVSNYPGNTVEHIEGDWILKDPAMNLIDLPGLYSLDTTSDDQEVARKVSTGGYEDLPKHNAIIAVIEATSLKRNLYLITELLECRVPSLLR